MDLNKVNIEKLPADVRRVFKQLQVLHAEKKIQNKAKNDFLSFVKCKSKEFVEGSHHRHIADKFNKLATGEINRLIINMPPRHTKSEFASYLLPAWMVGREPRLKIIQATHTGELAIRFGRKAKNLIDSEDYSKIFKTTLQEDSKAAGRWETSQGGEYFAAGVGGAITGRGADLLIIDDPHSEQDALSPTAMESAYEWYTSGPRQRLQPGGKIVLVMTRWSNKDLTGKLLANQKEAKADQWHVVEFPAIMDHGTKEAKPVWPEYWKLDELEKVQATLPVGKWNAQWMQKPTSEEGAIIKREWWQIWKHDWIPQLDHVIQSYDTAFLKKETADYSAITTWGVFYPDQDSGANLMLLDAIKGRYEFPELRRLALEQYKYWQPESVIVEAKASGLPLVQELRRIGIPVNTFSPGKGKDKIARLNSVSPIFQDGRVWIPDNRWGEELMDEVSDFPNGENDDLVDATTLALARFREGGFLTLSSDYFEEEEPYQGERVYY